MGDQLSEKTKAAWVKGMDYAFTFLKMRPSQTNVNSALATNDIALVRNFYTANRNNMAIVTKALMKYNSFLPIILTSVFEIQLHEQFANKV